MTPPNWQWSNGEVAGRVVVFDLDGVLSDAAGRQHFVDGAAAKDWEGFFSACADDPLLTEIHQLLELIDRSVRVVLLTARPLRVRTETLAWLERYEVRWDLLVMRADDDRRSAARFKQHSVEQLRGEGLDPLLAFEDDRRNVAMFRDLDVPCVYIHSGYYD